MGNICLMLKRFALLLLVFVLSQSLAWASIVSINSTKFSATAPVEQTSGDETSSGGESQIENSESSNRGAPQGAKGAGGEEDTDVSEADGDGSGDLDNDPEDLCYFTCADIGATDCVYSDIGSTPVDTNLKCKCSDTGNEILLCDDNYFNTQSKSGYIGYARGFGMNSYSGSSYDAYTGMYHQYYYYYPNIDTNEFCPVKLNSYSPIKLSALYSSYYDETRKLACSKPAFEFALVDDGSGQGISSCLPPQAVDNGQDVSICVYYPDDNSQDNYNKKYDYTYTGNDTGFENCVSYTNKLSESQLRTVYAMNDGSDIPSNASDYYYLYQPDSDHAVVDDYHATECFINCGSSVEAVEGEDYEISPYCQGWYYLQDCNSFVGDESNHFYLSDLSEFYMNAAANNAFSGKTEICYSTEDSIKKSFVRCGLKHSYDSVNGVYNETDCNVGNGTCTGATGQYTCDNKEFCSKCTCKSNLFTLSQWCAASGITENCDTAHYIPYGNACNYDDTSGDMSNPKYEQWLPLCGTESQYLALADTGQTLVQLKNGYGTGIEAQHCYSGNNIKWQVTCGSNYSMICYPTTSTTENWCIHGHDEDTTMRSEAQSATPNKYCQVEHVDQGICGSSVVLSDGTVISADENIKINKVSSQEQCYSQYGQGATVQACSDSADDDISGYNCYYDLRAFKYSTNKNNGAKLCEVRHDLRGEYIVYNGQKRWAECNCVDLYQYSIYNCTGNTILSGNACKQDLSNVNYSAALIDKWRRAGLPYDAEHNQITISSVNLYPYCKCRSNFAYTCDTNPGRVEPAPGSNYCTIGNKTYYEACTCKADDLPDNWSASYFGCTSGSTPTGIWKDNGCGEKIYQCSNSVACTPEYTEKCDGVGEVGDGPGCQDNEGNYVRWKACKCDIEYSTACDLENQSGIGEACTVDGGNKYKACGCPSEYQVCVPPAVVASGSTSCTIENNIEGSSQKTTEIVYSQCSCPSSWTDCSSDGQVGDDTNPAKVCVSGATRVYEKCKCPDVYENCAVSGTNRPLVPGIGAYTYTGVTATGYGVCKLPNVAWTEYRYQACKCNEERFTVCEGTGATPIGVSCQTEYDQSKLWTGCECGSGYTDQCLESEGKIVNPARDYDYCQINNGVKYYKEDDCLCEAAGWITCEATGQSGIGPYCLITGDTTNPKKYTSCGCESDYTNKCDGEGETPPSGAVGCTTSSGETYYNVPCGVVPSE